MENLRDKMESLSIINLRKQVTDEVLKDIFQFGTNQQLGKIASSPNSTQQMRNVCIKILTERGKPKEKSEQVTFLDNNNIKGKVTKGII